MRWNSNKLKIGDKRLRAGFLFLPKRIGDETRWLEVACWDEELQVKWSHDEFASYEVLRWVATRWANP